MDPGEKSDESAPTADATTPSEDGVPDAEAPKEEGLFAWLQVLGAFCVYLNTWGLLNSYGVFQTYYKLDFLSSQSTSTIGWIGSTQGALFFAVSIVVGPMFDLGYFRSLMWVGTAFIVVGMFLLSITNQFYQVLLTQSVLVGIGEGCLFLPAPAVVAQHFNARLGLAVSIASVGSAVGGIIYPVIFTQVLSRLGFGWATRIIAFVLLATSLPVVLMKSKTNPTASRSVIDWAAFTDLPFMLLNLGLVFGFMGLYIITTYFQLYALSSSSISASLADNLLIIINAGSLVGRVILGYLADKTGSVNMQTAVALVATILTFSLLAAHTPAALVVVAVLFGISSGAFLGLPVASIVRMSDDPSKIGTRIGMTLLFVGIGALISYPIAGAIVGDNSNWVGLIVFSGVLLAASTVVLAMCRIAKMSSTPAPAAVGIIDKLKSLSSELEQGASVTTQNEALLLARQLTASLSRPEDVAAELIFSTKREGNISDAFVSLSGGHRPPLPERFLDLKKSLVAGHEDQFIASWRRLLVQLKQENKILAKEGSNAIPSLEFENLDSDLTRLRSEIKRRGVAVVRGVIPQKEARAYKNDIEEYVRQNPSTKGKCLLL
ncbi:hypothetical protein NUW58_g8002 [Xylaria curta]|uniref:Uncharacterized protein n=1 Tax=Xylaria curta TaxID=42375 RepID=A0ACC1NCN0_9PEZI|nr:hypothetical protein NUW58_g8002 [Xylaria curta]